MIDDWNERKIAVAEYFVCFAAVELVIVELVAFGYVDEPAAAAVVVAAGPVVGLVVWLGVLIVDELGVVGFVVVAVVVLLLSR